jgi:hypothetical protein
LQMGRSSKNGRDGHAGHDAAARSRPDTELGTGPISIGHARMFELAEPEIAIKRSLLHLPTRLPPSLKRSAFEG